MGNLHRRQNANSVPTTLQSVSSVIRKISKLQDMSKSVKTYPSGAGFKPPVSRLRQPLCTHLSFAFSDINALCEEEYV